MKRIILALALTFVTASSLVGQPATATFKYRPDRSLAGTVLHYVKSNIDGSDPEFVSQYFADANTLESFKFHKGAFPAALVIAKMDWNSFAAKVLYSHRINSKTERPLFATLTFDERTRQAEVSIPTLRPAKEIVDLGRFPVHVYNFDLGSLNFALPHLRDRRAPFSFGIADPTFKDTGPLFAYKGEATVKFVATELRNGRSADKYSIDGPGLENRGGNFWVNAKTGWIEDIEIDLPDNPAWRTFKFKLIKSEKMSRKTWEKFILDQF